jgi:hypothetical protein
LKLVPDLDINTVRDRLNEETFAGGERRVCIGLVSELFAGLDDASVSKWLAAWERELATHDLALLRGTDQSDELYVEQTLRLAPIDMSWMRDAMHWTSRITMIALEMVAPGVVGLWADQRFGTGYLRLLGLLIGVPLGIWHLLRMTRRKPSS